MRYRRLGNSGLKVSEIGYGTWFLPASSELDEYGIPKIDEDESIKIMRKAYDLGINHIDTANRYHGAVAPIPLTHVGNAERIIGKFLKKVDRDEIVIATKVGFPMGKGPNDEGLSRKHVMKQLRDSLERLDTDYIDIYYAHRPDPAAPMEEVMRTFNILINQGLVLYIGCSNFSAIEILESVRASEKSGLEKFVCLQSPYNLLQRDIERDVIPVAKENNMGIVVYSPLAQGVLTGKYSRGAGPESIRAKYDKLLEKWLTEKNLKIIEELSEISKEKGVKLPQLAIAWLLHKPIVSSVIVGATKLEQLEENVEATEIKLSSDDLKRLDEITNSRKLS